MYVSQSESGTVRIGDITPSIYPATANFTNGTTVTFEAIPVAGYRFDGWMGDISGNTNPATVVMDCNKVITANFIRIVHTLTIQVSGNGTTVPAKGTYDYSEDTIVEINANADDGWYFDNWTGDVISPDSTNTTVIINSDITITANFTENTTSWLLIGGIIDGVLILGVVILLVLRRRGNMKLPDSNH